jgi:hypothetical protein
MVGGTETLRPYNFIKEKVTIIALSNKFTTKPS